MEHPRAGSAFNPYKRFQGFNVVPDCISNLPTISPLAKLVYGHLVRRAGKNGMAFPSVESIGKHFAVSERQARRAVSELRTENLIRTVRRVNEYGQTTNLYEFIWHEWMGRRTETSSTGVTDVSPIKEHGEETRSNTVLEQPPTISTKSRAAIDSRRLLACIIYERSGHTISDAQIDSMRSRATVAAGRPVDVSECANVAQVLPVPNSGPSAIQSAAWWVSAIPNAFGEYRAGAENFRPEDFMPSPAETPRRQFMAEWLDD